MDENTKEKWEKAEVFLAASELFAFSNSIRPANPKYLPAVGRSDTL